MPGTLVWPVYGHNLRREYIAYFFNWSDAASFVSENGYHNAAEPTHFERRNLYIGNPLNRSAK